MAAALLCGCASSQPPRPALLVAPTSACVEQLQSLLSERTGRRVTLSASALDGRSEIVLTPALPTDRDGRLLDGRQRPADISAFRITRFAGACYVGGSGVVEQTPLPLCQCAEVAK